MHRNSRLAQLRKKAGRHSHWALGCRWIRKNGLCLDSPELVLLHSVWAESVRHNCLVLQWLYRKFPSQCVFLGKDFEDLGKVFLVRTSWLPKRSRDSDCSVGSERQLKIHTSLGNTYMPIRWRQAKGWLRPSTCPDHWFWLVALAAMSHCCPKVVGARFLTHMLREDIRYTFFSWVLLCTQRRLPYLVSRTS